MEFIKEIRICAEKKIFSASSCKKGNKSNILELKKSPKTLKISNMRVFINSVNYTKNRL